MKVHHFTKLHITSRKNEILPHFAPAACPHFVLDDDR
jgi:hypothetical protein